MGDSSLDFLGLCWFFVGFWGFVDFLWVLLAFTAILLSFCLFLLGISRVSLRFFGVFFFRVLLVFLGFVGFFREWQLGRKKRTT